MSGMKVLVVGSGGREHAIVRKLRKDARTNGLGDALRIFAAPGNPGIAEMAECIAIAPHDIAKLRAFANNEKIDLTIVGPEVPLVAGIADRFAEDGLRIFGPSKLAAKLEGSKSFAREQMLRASVRHPHYKAFRDLHSAIAHVQNHPLPIVIKADGLAAGKGVVIATSREEAEHTLRQMMLARVFGEAGEVVLIEDYMPGNELSAMAFYDRHGFVPMPLIRDHKQLLDGGDGPNTGGMGAFSVDPAAYKTVRGRMQDSLFDAFHNHLKRVTMPFRGVLFAGLILQQDVFYVLEFNVRFGDPEGQVALELLESDLLAVIEAIHADRISLEPVKWSTDRVVCVVLTAAGYPDKPRTGDVITGLEQVKALETPPYSDFFPDPVWKRAAKAMGVLNPPQPPSQPIAYPLHAGTARLATGEIVTAGGRVMNVIGRAPTIEAAREIAYEGAEKIQFAGKHYRTDIGAHL